ncbi:MAG: metallophosphoesterase [Bacteroidetes bacterium]|nr:metallophosphoesterase [Bacteroidota bacterium]
MNDNNVTEQHHNDDGIDRAGFIKCMAWAGTGVLWLMSGGSMKAFGMSQLIDKHTGRIKDNIVLPKNDFSFVQISDSHIGFTKPANTDVTGTLRAAIAKINAMSTKPAFVLHTGDLSHLAQPEEFDTLDQELKSVKAGKIFYVPGEHDVLGDNGKGYLERYGKDTKGNGWYSYNYNDVHFIGLVNVLNIAEGGLGMLGQDQLNWLKDDLKGLSSSTPIVIFAHIPLWSVYPTWGWGTRDSEEALSYLKRFGSVSVLNGHIHQNMLKVEGNITFHSAASTAFPQPAPGTAPAPGPMKVPAEKLKSVLGLTSVQYMEHKHSLAITDIPLQDAAPEPQKTQ